MPIALKMVEMLIGDYQRKKVKHPVFIKQVDSLNFTLHPLLCCSALGMEPEMNEIPAQKVVCFFLPTSTHLHLHPSIILVLKLG
jgi:hypothetical protein